MKWFVRLFIVISCVVAVAPLFWYGLASPKTAAEFAQIPPSMFPEHPTLENYSELFTRRPFAAYYCNSVVIATFAAMLCIACSSPAAYKLARAPKHIRSIVTAILLIMAFFPPIALLFPVYELVRYVGLVNQPWGLIIPYAALNLPFAVWLLTGYMEQIPRELEEVNG